MTKDNNKIIIACICILSKNLYNVKMKDLKDAILIFNL